MASLQSERILDVEKLESKPLESKEVETIPDCSKREEKEEEEEEEMKKNTRKDDAKEEEAGPPPAIHESRGLISEKIGDSAFIKKIQVIINSHKKADQRKSAKPQEEEDVPKQSLASRFKHLTEDNAFRQQIYGRYKGGPEKKKDKAEKETTDPAGHVKTIGMAEKIKIKIGDNALIDKLEEIISSHKESIDNGGAEGTCTGKQSLAAKVRNIIEDNAFIQKIYGYNKGGEKNQNGGKEGPKTSEEKINGDEEGEAKPHVEKEEQKESISMGEKIKREAERNPLLQKIDGMIHGPKDGKKKSEGEKKGNEEEKKKNEKQVDVPLS